MSISGQIASHNEAGNGSAMPGIFAGVVTDNSDKEHKGLLTVRVPGFADQHDLLLEVRPVFPYAGEKQGLYFLPEVGDAVLVLIAGPGRAYALGSFYPPKGFGQECFQSGNTQKKFVTKGGFHIEIVETKDKEELEIRTPKGRRLLLSDHGEEVRLEAGEGNSVVMNSKKGTAELAAKKSIQLSVGKNKLTVDTGGIKLSGDALEIKGQTLKMEGKLSAELSGQNLSLQGKMSAKMKSSATLELSGGIIKLNG